MALEPGTRLGSYQILTRIGVGGMGEVYNSGDSPKLIAARLDISPMNVYDEGIWASVARQRTDYEG